MRFYVKSILVGFSRSKTAILTNLETSNFDILGILNFEMSEIYNNAKFRAGKMVKMAVFDLPKSVKIDFT